MERNARTQLNFFDIVAAEKKHPLSRDQLIRCGLDPPLRAHELMYSQFLEYYTRQQKPKAYTYWEGHSSRDRTTVNYSILDAYCNSVARRAVLLTTLLLHVHGPISFNDLCLMEFNILLSRSLLGKSVLDCKIVHQML